MKSDQMGTRHNNPSPRELPLSNQARFNPRRGPKHRPLLQANAPVFRGWNQSRPQRSLLLRLGSEVQEMLRAPLVRSALTVGFRPLPQTTPIALSSNLRIA